MSLLDPQPTELHKAKQSSVRVSRFVKCRLCPALVQAGAESQLALAMWEHRREHTNCRHLKLPTPAALRAYGEPAYYCVKCGQTVWPLGVSGHA